MTTIEWIIYRETNKRIVNRRNNYGLILRGLDNYLYDLFTKWYHEENGVVYLNGMHGIMALFDCSYTKALQIKKTIIQDAIIQSEPGKPFMVDVDKAVALYSKHKAAK